MLTRSTRILFPYVCIVFAFALLSFGSSSKVSATEDVDYNVSIAPSLNLTIPSNPIIINLDPSSKTFDSKDFSVVVATNNRTGYTLTLSTPNDNTNLSRDTASDGVSAIMPTLDPGTYTQSSFTADKWGYKINSNTSIPSTVTSGYVPFVSGNTLMESDTAVNHDEAELSLAAKIDYLQPSGSYSTELNFSLVAHPQVDYMQNLNPTLCTTSPMTAVDKRDGREYTIQRLADGNCWVLDNLHLDISDPAVQAKLDSTTTNATDTSLGYLKNGGGTAPYATNGVVARSASSSGSWVDSYVAPYIDTTYMDDTTTSYGIGSGKIGIYYNYCAASAGSYCYASGAGVGDASEDICPSGWRMPTDNGASGEYGKLYAAYSSNVTNFKTALSTPLAGFTGNGSYGGNRGTRGYHWSSTFASATLMHETYVDGSTVSLSYSHGRYLGLSVRCVLDDNRTISDITNMQAMTPVIAANTAEGATATLKDTRDSQRYTVAKINGQVWMTRNLAIGCDGTGSTYGSTITSRTLTPANTDIATNYTTPVASHSLSLLGDDVSDPRIECSTTYGAWYNYPATTAGTIVGTSTSAEAQYSVCPAGWRLPTNAEENGITSATYAAAFSPVAGGVWGEQQILVPANGQWWSSTANGNTYRRYMYYSGGSTFSMGSQAYRYYGYYIRCIAR